MSRVNISATDGHVRDAAERAALSDASALEAALHGYLVAAAADPGVLLSPVSIVLAGFGAKRAIDGRLRQPGAGERRPRGFLETETIPAAAYVAIPTSLVALFVAFSYDAKRVRLAAVRAGLSEARRCKAPHRAAFFERMADVGAAAFRRSAVERALLAVASSAQRGLVTASDFDAVPEVDFEPRRVGSDLRAPWYNAGTQPTGELHAIVAIERRGNAVALCYERATQGIPILDGELIAPRAAVPVQRGIRRLRPGTPLPAACNVAIELDAEGVPGAARADALGLRVAR